MIWLSPVAVKTVRFLGQLRDGRIGMVNGVAENRGVEQERIVALLAVDVAEAGAVRTRLDRKRSPCLGKENGAELPAAEHALQPALPAAELRSLIAHVPQHGMGRIKAADSPQFVLVVEFRWTFG